MADGTAQLIEQVRLGDLVLAFGPHTTDEPSQLLSRRVTRLYTNVTTEWLKLSFASETGSTNKVTVTPGHHFLTPSGEFERIDDIIGGGGAIVLADGSVTHVKAERIVYSAETAHLYEEAEQVEYAVSGGNALAPEVKRGWRTYNFEVEDLHTYVAGGVRVHNDSWPTLVVARDQFEAQFKREFTGSQEDIDALMGGIANGEIKAYGDYVGGISDDGRYSAAAYDAIRNHIEGSVPLMEAGDAIAIQVQGDRLSSFNVKGDRIDFTTLDQDGFALDTSTYDRAGNQIGRRIVTDEGAELSQSLTGGEVTYKDQFGTTQSFSIAGLGSTLGSTIGSFLGGNSLEGRALGSTVVGMLGGELGRMLQQAGDWGASVAAIGYGGGTMADAAGGAAVKGLGGDGNTFVDGVGGGLSSLLVGEAAQALGLSGFGGGLFTTVGTTITSKLVHNLTGMVMNDGLSNVTLNGLFEGFDSQFVGGMSANVGGFLGSYIGAQLVPAEGKEGALGGAIGSSLGTFGATTIISSIGATVGSVIPFVGTFIGALAGQVIGTLFGNLFYDPPIATLSVGDAGGDIGTVGWYARHGGDPKVFGQLAASVSDAANQLIGQTGGELTGIGGTGLVTYNQDGQSYYAVFPTGAADWFRTKSSGNNPDAWSRVADESILALVGNAQITKGDPIMMAALAAASQQDTNSAAIATDLQVAQEYKTYLKNTEAINLLMAMNPDSAFAAGWQLTLLRAQELGLNQVGDEDGWTATLESGSATGGDYKFHETVRDANGLLVEEEFFNNDGSQTDYQYFKNQVVTLSGATIKVVNGATYSITGSGNTILAGKQSNVSLTGDDNGIDVTGKEAALHLSGVRNAVRMSDGSVVLEDNSSVTITGDHVAVTEKSNAVLTVNGSSATVDGGRTTGSRSRAWPTWRPLPTLPSSLRRRRLAWRWLAAPT